MSSQPKRSRILNREDHSRTVLIPTHSSHMTDADSAAAQDIEEAGPSLSQLWGYFEEADSNAKLILPDLLTNLYYLPLPKANKAKKDAQFEREMRRLDFMCQKEGSNFQPINKAGIMAMIPNYGLNGRDRAIERRLVDPYRRDAQKRAAFLQEVAEKQARLGVAVEATNKPKPKPPVHPKPLAKLSREEREERQTLVVQRRTTLLDSAQENLQLRAQMLASKQEKVAQTLEEHAEYVAQLRVARLLQIVYTINSLNTMYNVVNAARKMKAQSPVRWKACIKIQKWYRKIRFYGHKKFDNVKGSSKVNTIVQMLKSMAVNGPNRSYSTRQHACTVITSFLRELQGRMTVYVKKFVSKIKKLQRLLKQHFATNEMRLSLMDRLFDACLPAVLLHMELVMQGRGHDLQNLTSYDINKIGVEYRHSKRHRLVGLMNTAHFHGYLRNHLTQIPLVMATFKTNTKLPKEVVSTKKEEMFDLLQRKRRQHIRNLETVKIVRLHIPKFDTGHVKTFILGGHDPLSHYLREAQDEQNVQHAAYETARLAKRGSGAHKKGQDSQKLCLLLQNIDVEDITFLAMSVAAKSVDAKSLSIRSSAAPLVAGKSAKHKASGIDANSEGSRKVAQALDAVCQAHSASSNAVHDAHYTQEGTHKNPKHNHKHAHVHKKSDGSAAGGHVHNVEHHQKHEAMRPATPPGKPSSTATSTHTASPQKARRLSISLQAPL